MSINLNEGAGELIPEEIELLAQKAIMRRTKETKDLFEYLDIVEISWFQLL